MAKLDARRLPAFLKDPGPTRAVLLHGEDAGLVRERAEAIQQAVIGGDDELVGDGEPADPSAEDRCFAVSCGHDPTVLRM